jgi:hypothetical protein
MGCEKRALQTALGGIVRGVPRSAGWSAFVGELAGCWADGPRVAAHPEVGGEQLVGAGVEAVGGHGRAGERVEHLRDVRVRNSSRPLE